MYLSGRDKTAVIIKLVSDVTSLSPHPSFYPHHAPVCLAAQISGPPPLPPHPTLETVVTSPEGHSGQRGRDAGSPRRPDMPRPQNRSRNEMPVSWRTVYLFWISFQEEHLIMTREGANLHWRCQADDNEPHPQSGSLSCSIMVTCASVQHEIWCMLMPTGYSWCWNQAQDMKPCRAEGSWGLVCLF